MPIFGIVPRQECASHIFTYSYWDDEQALEKYRNSDLFKSLWTKTKQLFNIKPEAWSVDKIESLK